MIHLNNIQPGDKVHYKPFKDCDESQYENGKVKSLTPDGKGAFVVYNCNGEWSTGWVNYTAANTNASDLFIGWNDKARNAIK